MTHLFAMQKWFATMIAQPLQENHLLPPLSPFGTMNELEAAQFIVPSPTLQPLQRIQIYHQQYWWRLIKALQMNFATLIRLFGDDAFQNRLAVPYLTLHPPQHWSLARLGESFPQWLQENYSDEDHYLVFNAASIDWATNEAFWIHNLPAVDFASLSPDETLAKKLVLQPFIHLFALQGDFFTFREELLQKEPEYYNANPFPKMHYGEHHFVLYRTPKNVVTWKQISPAEFWMLSQFKEGNTIEGACERLAEQGGEILQEALSQLPFWFKQWTVLKWFGSLSSSSY